MKPAWLRKTSLIQHQGAIVTAGALPLKRASIEVTRNLGLEALKALLE
jgi:hypothetical protein